MWWQALGNFVGILGGSTIAVAVLGYLARSLISQWLAKDIETYKNELQRTNDRELERLRSDLKIRSLEHEVRFRHLYEKQAETIAEVYGRGQLMLQAVNAYLIGTRCNPKSPNEATELYEKAQRSLQHFVDYFGPRRIYLPERLGDQIMSLYSQLSTELIMDDLSGRVLDFDAVTAKCHEFLPIQESLHKEYQRLLGVVCDSLATETASGSPFPAPAPDGHRTRILSGPHTASAMEQAAVPNPSARLPPDRAP